MRQLLTKPRLGKIAPAGKSEISKSSFIITIPEKIGLGKYGQIIYMASAQTRVPSSLFFLLIYIN